ncbi:hypothetical protein PCASD_05692 [Puccinia coronata f. sp. avenae]|uniref:Uncharacterized protein n=1 Tax=Puccinia coronata f. sp. avenae TaxID=200324 RepID=A0A2N5UVV5_9BASI|nr:hypothetical protein PCASD_05692 [Puccinia coronata f. sp. avenae]
MNPWKTPSSSIPTLTAEQQKVVYTVVHQRTEHFESVVAMLTKEQSSVQTQDKTPSAPASNFKGKANIDKQKEPAKKTSGRKSIPGPPPTALLSTPKRAIRATSAPPKLGNTKPRKLVKDSKKLEIVKAPSPRRHPQQMTTADVPREFNSTKASVPPAPELQYLQEFYQRFSTNNQVKHAAKTTSSPALISSNEIQLFKDATSGSVKYGQQVIHVGSNNVRYSQGLMGRLGLQVWCPNLEEDSASLYNAAHRIAAITTFQELVSSRAYDHMNVNPVLAMDSYWDILVEPYGLLEAESSACENKSDDEAEDLSDRVNSNSESEGHDLDATSPDVLEDEYHEEGDAGSLYDEDGFVTSDNNGNDNQDDDDRDDDDQDNDKDGEDEDSGDEDWHEEGVNYEQDGDIAMKTNYGVSQAMLNIMEENEEGW